MGKPTDPHYWRKWRAAHPEYRARERRRQAGRQHGDRTQEYARRAAQREEDEARTAMPPKTLAQPKRRGEGSRGQFREGLHEIELALRRFVERELIAILEGTPRWTHGTLVIAGVDLGSNRIRIRLSCPRLPLKGGDGEAQTETAAILNSCAAATIEMPVINGSGLALEPTAAVLMPPSDTVPAKP